ncbi:MAG TPA: DUF222 domain-containing protein [Galbitalea sp.]|jgi:hypothetical protein
MTSITQTLQQATALLTELVGVDFAALSHSDQVGMLAPIEAIGRLADAARIKVAAEVDESSRFELGTAGASAKHGHRKPIHLIEERTRVSQAEVVRRIRLGRVTRVQTSLLGDRMPPRRPTISAALFAGELGVDSAYLIEAMLRRSESGSAAGSSATAELIAVAERALVESAAVQCADLVCAEARVWREALDPDGAEPSYEETLALRSVTVGRERNGITDIHIKADPIGRAIIVSVLADSTVPGAQPRFMSDEDAVRGATPVTDDAGNTIESIADLRTRAQKQYDIFFGTLQASARTVHTGGAATRSTASVVATISLHDLEAGTGIGWLDGIDEPIPASVVQELACDGGIRRMVLGNAGEPLYLGDRERYFTSGQRRALAVRDGGCVRCGAPPSWCHAHHVLFSSRGGPTDVDNGVLLCPAHHHALHAGLFEIRMVDRMPQLRTLSLFDADGEWRPGRRSRVAITETVSRLVAVSMA